MEATSLAKKLKDLRRLRGMSQEYLADEAKVSLRTIQRIENNESIPTGETIKRIASALDVKLNELVDSGSITETTSIKTTIIFLKKQLSKTNKKSEIKTFEKFIDVLNKLKERDLSPEQKEGIESYINYLELEKIPSFSNDIFKQKLVLFIKYLKNKLHFVPRNHYTFLTSIFFLPFSIGFGVTNGVSISQKIIVISIALSFIGIGALIDLRIKAQKRSFNF